MGMVRTSSCDASTFDCRTPGAGLLAPMLRRYYDATILGATQGAYASPHPDCAGPQRERLLACSPSVRKHYGRYARC